MSERKPILISVTTAKKLYDVKECLKRKGEKCDYSEIVRKLINTFDESELDHFHKPKDNYKKRIFLDVSAYNGLKRLTKKFSVTFDELLYTLLVKFQEEISDVG